MKDVGQSWREMGGLTGAETQLLLHKPQDLQEQLLFLNVHRHLLARGVLLKGITDCFSAIPGAFSAEALKLQYLAFTKRVKSTLEELPEWRGVFDQWIWLKYALDLSEDELLSRVVSIPGLKSQEMLVAFINCIAEDLLQIILKRSVKLG
jgi:hypothetical protein